MAERELQDARIKLTIDDGDLRQTMRRIERENQKSQDRRQRGGRNSQSLNSQRRQAATSFPTHLFDPMIQVVPELAPLARLAAAPALVATRGIGRVVRALKPAEPMMVGEKITEAATAAAAAKGAAKTPLARRLVGGAVRLGGLIAVLDALVPVAVGTGAADVFPPTTALNMGLLQARRLGNAVSSSAEALSQMRAITAASGFAGEQALDFDTARGLLADIQNVRETASDLRTGMRAIDRQEAGKVISNTGMDGLYETEIGQRVLREWGDLKESAGGVGTKVLRTMADWFGVVNPAGVGWR